MSAIQQRIAKISERGLGGLKEKKSLNWTLSLVLVH